MIAPDEIQSDSDAVPLDFTRLSSRQLGSVHSRFAVRHAHILFICAVDASALAVARRNLKLEQAKYRVRNALKYKTKFSLDAAMTRDSNILEIEDAITDLDVRLEIQRAIAEGYEAIRNAASREMYRRGTEVAPKD